MKYVSIIAVFILIINGTRGFAQPPSLKPKADMLKLIDQNITHAVAQYKLLMKHVPDDSLPETFDKSGNWRSISAKNWVSGFYPATLFYLYSDSRDEELYNEGLKKLKVLEPIQYLNSHDIGFMMYCSYGNANRIHPKAVYDSILLTSARTLAKRFNPKVGCTMSWSSKPGEFRVIIDNMMNLELLMYATKISGDSTYAKVAITHANTTMKNHFRSNYSSYHLVNYNSETGSIIAKQTVQGYSDASSWARGQSWGLYGFTMMYRETKNTSYLKQAINIANYIINHPNLPVDKVPYWDYNSPGIPHALRDASAGAIYASALIELAGYVDAAQAQKYLTVAETVIKTLSSPAFKAAYGDNGGFILKHSVGHLPKGAMVDVPLTYADYYYIEAMLRYKNLGKKNISIIGF